jgi:prepilin-type N-terminal cleavage/methylation domain-containing protein
MRPRCPIGPKHRRAGFTLIEVIFALTIFLAMVVVFGAVFPIAITASKFSNNYSQAAELAQHKLDQLRDQPWSNYNATNFVSSGSNSVGANLVTANIVDSGTCTADPNDASGIRCSFVDTDNVANNGSNIGYFPAGSTAYITIDPDTTTTSANEPPAYSVYTATVAIAWTGGGVSSGSYSASAKLVEDVTP